MLLAWRWDKEGMPWMDFRLGAQCAFARTPLLGSGILKEGVETGRATPSDIRERICVRAEFRRVCGGLVQWRHRLWLDEFVGHGWRSLERQRCE